MTLSGLAGLLPSAFWEKTYASGGRLAPDGQCGLDLPEGIDLLDLGSAEIRQDVAIDSAAIVGNGDRRDRPDLLTPAEPALDQLGDGPRGAPAVLATVDLLQELRLDLLGFPVGPLGLSRDLAADPSYAAGKRVAAG